MLYIWAYTQMLLKFYFYIKVKFNNDSSSNITFTVQGCPIREVVSTLDSHQFNPGSIYRPAVAVVAAAAVDTLGCSAVHWPLSCDLIYPKHVCVSDALTLHLSSKSLTYIKDTLQSTCCFMRMYYIGNITSLRWKLYHANVLYRQYTVSWIMWICYIG